MNSRNKQVYQKPQINIVSIRTFHVLSGSGGPQATWISNPNVSGSRSSRTWEFDEDEDW